VSLAILSQCEKDEPNPIVNIPDNNFLNALIELGVDTNGDGLINPEESANITSHNVSNKNISDMTGIEAFVNLDTLICANNQIARLDISNSFGLKRLVCFQNKISSLDVSNNLALKVLVCKANQLTSLDVSGYTALIRLYCDNNQLTTLDISNNTALREVSLKDMPTLEEVCVWRMPFPSPRVSVDTKGSPNVSFTTDCN